MYKLISFRVSFFLATLVAQTCYGFQAASTSSRLPTTRLGSSEYDESEDLLLAKNLLAENYPAFNEVLSKNDAVWKAIGASDGAGFTIFVPNADAFQALGEQKWGQLMDPRNLETTEKVGAYHVISETVTADQLFNSGGVITLGGEVPVDRSVSGGMFGLGGKEDGGVTVNGAKVVQTFELGSGLVHEVNGLVAPSIVWRYMDQLRIPGSS